MCASCFELKKRNDELQGNNANLQRLAVNADKQIKYLQHEIDKNLTEAEVVTDALRLCVCKLYDAELITASRACELLGVKMQSFQFFYRSDWRDKW
jgi:hypothetical protein